MTEQMMFMITILTAAVEVVYRYFIFITEYLRQIKHVSKSASKLVGLLQLKQPYHK